MKKINQKECFKWMYEYLIEQPEAFFEAFDEPTAKSQVLDIIKGYLIRTGNYHKTMKKDALDEDIINALMGITRETALTIPEILERTELSKQISGTGTVKGALTRLVNKKIVHRIPPLSIGTCKTPVKYFLEPDYLDKIEADENFNYAND